jgi:4-amino-4-deoxy-L-arabinose transferase-like glycosyltransferase
MPEPKPAPLVRPADQTRTLTGAIILAALGLAYLRTLAPGVTWANNGADSGDLVAAAATLGVAHPTGYPTYLLLARAFQLLPIGDLAYRSTLLSAVAALLTVSLLYHMGLMLLNDRTWQATVSAAAGALAIGLAPVFWSQAVIAEVYSLNALFVALLLWLALRRMRGRMAPPGGVVAEGLVAGLALGNHVTAGLAVAAWLVAMLWWSPAERRWRRAIRGGLGLAAGLLVYLYLPLRAAAHPPINWGNPADLAGLWWEISGQPYRDLAFGLPANFLTGRAAAWAGLLIEQFGPVGLALGFGGLLYGAPGERRFVWLSAALALASSAFAIGYNTADSYAYLIPAYMVFALWIGLGLAAALGLLARRGALPGLLAAVAGLAALIWPAPSTAARVDASQDRRAIVFAVGALADAPDGALVVTSSDLDTFPIWYYHFAIGQRPDVRVVVEPLLGFQWYRDNLRATYPALRLTDAPPGTWADELAALAGQPELLCRTDPQGAMPLSCGAP